MIHTNRTVLLGDGTADCCYTSSGTTGEVMITVTQGTRTYSNLSDDKFAADPSRWPRSVYYGLVRAFEDRRWLDVDDEIVARAARRPVQSVTGRRATPRQRARDRAGGIGTVNFRRAA